uniref:Uncharacterized protein n=1 Tax=Candidatus Kentrum sp. FW TaxID=2126338 RepID=A0A450U362_9GAMM|nr:MAG: hypothetical protein BECKFW1821C_GA0114237_112910 [Candidatus Kentron sp. FW]
MSEKIFFPMSQVLGYGSELADALLQYPRLKREGNESGLDYFRNMWGEWMSRCPHARHLCFADITFFPEGSLTTEDALSLIIAPATDAENGNKNVENYKEALLDKYIGAGFTMAAHEVFRSGLPSSEGSLPPQTSSDLNEFFRRKGTSSSDIEDSLLVGKFHVYAEPIAQMVSSDRVCFSVGETSTYKKPVSTTMISARPISEHFSKWCEVFDREAREGRLRSAEGGSLHWTIVCPVGNRNPKNPSDYTLISCLFLGFDAALNEVQWHESLRYITLHLYEANAAARANRIGQVRIQATFAHQTSAVIDSILDSMVRLPEDIRRDMGGILMAKLYLLRETIHSYRVKSSRRDPGPFLYPWREGENPLAVYRDIGIQLGLARCEEAPREEQKVREMGSLARMPEYQPSQPGFDGFRRLFEDIPPVSPDVCRELQHSFFAVIILLVFKQAVYHTVRARKIGGNPSAKISVRIEDRGDGVLFSCGIMNPPVTQHDEEFAAKDREELLNLANRLSRLPERPNTYSVEGPRFSKRDACWKTRICIYEKRDSGAES